MGTRGRGGDVNVDVAISVRCTECGTELEIVRTNVGRANQDDIVLDVEPCEKCLGTAKSDGYDEGKSEAEEAT
jgi:hypothetical protein